MPKNINENATARIDLQGLESSDMETLSQILRLAGQAELHSDSIDGGLVGLEPEISAPTTQEPQSELVTDAGITPDMFGPDENSYNVDSEIDDIMSLSGIVESKLLPEELLEVGNKEEYGPFETEQSCVAAAQSHTNGVENDHFRIIPRNDGFYWARTLEEDIDFRPKPEEVNTDGIINSRHRIKDKIAGLGDNHLLPVSESEEIKNEEDETVEEIFESINKRFNKFMGE